MDDGTRIEVKYSIVKKAHRDRIDANNVVETVLDAANGAYRGMTLDEALGPSPPKFDCNMQQVKRSQFDVLIYGLCYALHAAKRCTAHRFYVGCTVRGRVQP